MQIDHKSVSDELVSEQVFQFLRDSIATGKWSPGEKIPSEMKLCQQLGVSRVSVRSAIDRLASRGILESKKGKGTFVCRESQYHPLDGMYSAITLHQTDRLDVFEYRKIIEAASAEYAALRATTEMVDAMNLAVRRMKEADNAADIVKYDWEFHYLIAKATGNELILRTFEILRDTYLRQFEENISVMGSEGAIGHGRIVSAIEIRDAKLARTAMLEHLDMAARTVAIARLNGRSPGVPPQEAVPVQSEPLEVK